MLISFVEIFNLNEHPKKLQLLLQLFGNYLNIKIYFYSENSFGKFGVKNPLQKIYIKYETDTNGDKKFYNMTLKKFRPHDKSLPFNEKEIPQFSTSEDVENYKGYDIYLLITSRLEESPIFVWRKCTITAKNYNNGFYVEIEEDNLVPNYLLLKGPKKELFFPENVFKDKIRMF